VCDIAGCLAAFPDLDWDVVLSAASAAGTTRQLLLGLGVAEDLLGTTIPARVPRDPAVVPLVQRVRARMLGPRDGPMPDSALLAFCLRAFESRGHRLRYLRGHLAPSWAEYRSLPLPPFLYWAYYLFRPLRLVARRVRRAAAPGLARGQVESGT
jgi:hypothetical protein